MNITSKKRWMALVLALLLIAPVFGCSEDKGPAERAGEKVDQAVEKTKESINQAAEQTREGLEKAGDKIENATD